MSQALVFLNDMSCSKHKVCECVRVAYLVPVIKEMARSVVLCSYMLAVLAFGLDIRCQLVHSKYSVLISKGK